MNKHNNVSLIIQDIKLYLSPSIAQPFLAEPNINGIKACVIYKKWLEHVLMEIVAVSTKYNTQELAIKITTILNRQLLRLLQPEYILSELNNEQVIIQG